MGSNIFVVDVKLKLAILGFLWHYSHKVTLGQCKVPVPILPHSLPPVLRFSKIHLLHLQNFHLLSK